VRLDAATLAPLSRVRAKDPKSGEDARFSDEGTASPVVGPDGDVAMGVLENPSGSNHRRGWLLRYDAALSVARTPGAFGWDTTPSILPPALVPSYTGGAPYLLSTKVNDYDAGLYRLAILDPFTSELDAASGIATMKVVIAKQAP